MKQEIWKDIEGYKGLYQVSNLGHVKSLARLVDYGRCKKFTKERMLKQLLFNTGYYYVRLSKNGVTKSFAVHRLVAIAFVSGFKNELVVNHIDENPQNNLPENLEWVTPRQNNIHGTRIERMSRAKFVAVEQYDLDGVLVAKYPSVKAAEAATGVDNRNICACCRGKRRSSGGYHWAYAMIEKSSQPKLNKKRKAPLQCIIGEEWRYIDGYEGRYMVSNMGRIWSVHRQQLRKPVVKRDGRLEVSFITNNKPKHFLINRLVALAFVEGYAPGLVVNHINEDVTDNRAVNLEWCNQDYNLHFGTRTERMARHFMKPILQCSKSGEVLAEFPSLKAAAEYVGVSPGSISDAITGRSYTSAGYEWRLKKEGEIVVISDIEQSREHKAIPRKPASIVQQFTKDNRLVAEYASSHKAATVLNISASNIRNCCNGRIPTAYGYIWKYKK